MSDMDATPRPWAWSAKTTSPYDVDVYEAATTAGVARILGGNDQDYGDELVQQLAEANADLIVRAVSVYDAVGRYFEVVDDHVKDSSCSCKPNAPWCSKTALEVLRTAFAQNSPLPTGGGSK